MESVGVKCSPKASHKRRRRDVERTRGPRQKRSRRDARGQQFLGLELEQAERIVEPNDLGVLDTLFRTESSSSALSGEFFDTWSQIPTDRVQRCIQQSDFFAPPWVSRRLRGEYGTRFSLITSNPVVGIRQRSRTLRRCAPKLERAGDFKPAE